MTPPSSVNNRTPAGTTIPAYQRILRGGGILLLLATANVANVAHASAEPVLSIRTTAAGVYQVRYEDLASSLGGGEQAARPWPSAGLGLTNRGVSVPIWVDDGGDGIFGAGDTLEFVAEILPGSHGAFHEHSSFNAYLLTLQAASPVRMTAAQGQRVPAPIGRARQDYSDTVHMEVDTLLMRFGCPRESEHELWYWQKLASVDDEPFSHTFNTPALNRGRGRVRLDIDLHGWSTIYQRVAPMTDHQLEVYLNDTLVHEEAWNGKLVHRVSLTDLDPALLKDGDNTVQLRVPGRRDAEGRSVADAVVLNWMRIDYPRTGRVHEDRQAHYRLPAGVRGSSAMLQSRRPLRLYSADGSRFDVPAAAQDSRSASDESWLVFSAKRSFQVVPEGTLLRPDGIVAYRGARVAALEKQTDYIAIVHRDLREAIAPLIEYRRANGLTVEVVTLDEVYDAFNHGIPHPAAVREFLRGAYESWPRPAPRFALLVGDASWDSKHETPQLENYAFKTGPLQNDGVGRAEGTGYEGSVANDRGLIPTWNYLTRSGHAASDNWFVSFDDDLGPEMAIGRFPVVSAQETREVVAKTLAHERGADDEWRKKSLWITNEQSGFQTYSDRLATSFSDRGYVANKIYPISGEAGNSQRIIDALDEGQFLVYFYGHGGRFIWRTSPLDLNENRDLFSLSDLDRLQPTEKTPVVMSFTCYSAPFDHPSEDSIGEKLVRIGGRGAVAVIAASWRNAPSLSMQRQFIDAIAESATIGEALVRAKQRIRSPVMVETYNLLGDPALRLRPLPARSATKAASSPVP